MPAQNHKNWGPTPDFETAATAALAIIQSGLGDLG